jgi:hypothetical protein
MEEARRVLARLARIEQLEREHAPADQLLGELQELVREAEAWVRVEPGADAGAEAVERCRVAVSAHERDEVVLLAQ